MIGDDRRIFVFSFVIILLSSHFLSEKCSALKTDFHNCIKHMFRYIGSSRLDKIAQIEFSSTPRISLTDDFCPEHRNRTSKSTCVTSRTLGSDSHKF